MDNQIRRETQSKSTSVVTDGTPPSDRVERDPHLVSADVSERLLAKGRESQRRKVELLKEREQEEARNTQRAVPISKGTTAIAMSSEGVR